VRLSLHHLLRSSNSALRYRSLRKINCSLQNARVEKAAEKDAWWAAMWHAGLHLKPSLLIASLLHCTPHNTAFRSSAKSSKLHRQKICTVGCEVSPPTIRYATPLPQPPQNQLHLAECSCRKSCMVGCEVLRWLAPNVLTSLLSKEIASVLIAGVIVVTGDWKRLLGRAKS